ncbi:MAG: hypothetical protein J7605_05835 [Variovorax sp.]|nr:hypothetical protein [Variovorax sp.]
MRHPSSSRARRPAPASQRGIMLIEALVAIAIFSFAVLGIVGLQAASIRVVRDADYRAKASLLANQIVGHMWADRFNVPTFALNSSGTACTQGANESTNAVVTSWLTGMTDLSNPGALPGAAGLKQQIAIGTNNTVTLTICWQGPQDTAPHNFTMTTQIQG